MAITQICYRLTRIVRYMGPVKWVAVAGRTSVCDQRTFPVLRSTCIWWV